jgi:hypothetical protein
MLSKKICILLMRQLSRTLLRNNYGALEKNISTVPYNYLLLTFNINLANNDFMQLPSPIVTSLSSSNLYKM